MAPADALAQLMADEDSTVAWNAILNPKTPAAALAMSAAEEERQFGNQWFHRRHYIACHPNTPVGLQTALLRAGACDCRSNCCAEMYYARST